HTLKRIIADTFEYSPQDIIQVCKEVNSVEFITEMIQMLKRVKKAVDAKAWDIKSRGISEGLTEEEILTLAAHQVGHTGELTESDLDKIKLAVKIALAKDNK
ncbi:MAG: hypothetical protein AAGU75_09730, partial [Bacillota bacterium]